LRTAADVFGLSRECAKTRINATEREPTFATILLQWMAARALGDITVARSRCRSFAAVRQLALIANDDLIAGIP
jgi:hypothetical protein